ncbi:MAG: hypothetical protein RL619_99, partial [Bacteroidota bacterium]
EKAKLPVLATVSKSERQAQTDNNIPIKNSKVMGRISLVFFVKIGINLKKITIKVTKGSHK